MMRFLLLRSMGRGRECLLLVASAVGVTAQESGPELFRWRATTALHEARAGACAVKLGDGRVLVAGGDGGGGAINSAEIYRQGEGFTMAAYMTAARTGHTCTLLDDGRVLVYGGGEAAEVYDASADRWERVETAGPARWGHTATKLATGDVLFVGGEGANGVSGAVERWDRGSGTFRAFAAVLGRARKGHATAVLPDGRLLITGGSDGASVLRGSELLDPNAETVAAGPDLPRARSEHSAMTLYDERVLIAGGAGEGGELAEVEVYQPRTGEFQTLAGTLQTPRRGHLTLFLEGNGAVLFAGGTSAGEPTGTSELFQPWDDQMLAAGALTLGRASITGVMMDGGEVLAAGGATRAGVVGACGVLTAPTLRLYVVTPNGNRSAVFEGETVTADGANWGYATKLLQLKLQSPSGLQFDAPLLREVVLDPVTFQVEAFRVPGQERHGYRYLLTVSDGIKSAQASIDVKQPTRFVSVSGTPAILGSPVYLNVQLEAVRPATAASVARVGGLPLVNGIVSTAFTDSRGRMAGQGTMSKDLLPPLGDFGDGLFTFNICCAGTIGTFQTERILLSTTRNYVGTSFEPVTFQVIDNVASFEIFTVASPVRSFRLGVAKEFSAKVLSPTVQGPALTGTATLARGANPAESINIDGGGNGPRMTYTPKVADMAGICFTLQYSGNSSWKPFRDTKCLPVDPTPSVLSISTSGGDYSWGTPISLPLTLSWVATDARFLNKTARITAISGQRRVVLDKVTLNQIASIGAVTGEGASMWSLPMNVTAIEVDYSGSTDIADATARTPISMAAIPTVTSLSVVSASGGAVKLTARVTPSPATAISKYNEQVWYEGPSGTVRFFDGSLLLGSVPIGANIEAAPQVTFDWANVLPGMHNFRAVFEPKFILTYRASEAAVGFVAK